MNKITKKNIKKFWEDNKKKIIIGGTAVAGLITIIITSKKPIVKSLNATGICKPSRKIPDVEGFKILDIGDDVDDGCVVWLDGCKLSDCGKFGEGITKIDRVDPEMLITMTILSKDKLKLEM